MEILVGLDLPAIQQLRRTLQPVPQSKLIRALIDSGSDVTCLDPSIVRALSLSWTGPVATNMPAAVGFTFASFHRAGITILDASGSPRINFVAADLAVGELPLGVLGYDAVIGRDILDLMRFTYDGPARVFVLSWN